MRNGKGEVRGNGRRNGNLFERTVSNKIPTFIEYSIFKNINGMTNIVNRKNSIYELKGIYELIFKEYLANVKGAEINGWLGSGINPVITDTLKFERFKKIVKDHPNDLHSIERLVVNRVIDSVSITNLIFDFDVKYSAELEEKIIFILKNILGVRSAIFRTGSGNIRVVISFNKGEVMKFGKFKRYYEIIYAILGYLFYVLTNGQLKIDLAFLKNISQSVFLGGVKVTGKENIAYVTKIIKGRLYTFKEFVDNVCAKLFEDKLDVKNLVKFKQIFGAGELYRILIGAYNGKGEYEILENVDYDKFEKELSEYFFDNIDENLMFERRGAVANRKLFPVPMLTNFQIAYFLVSNIKYRHNDESKYIYSVYLKFVRKLREKMFKKYELDKDILKYDPKLESKFQNVIEEFVGRLLYIFKNDKNIRRVKSAADLVKEYFEFAGENFDDVKTVKKFFDKKFKELNIAPVENVIVLSKNRKKEVFEQIARERAGKFIYNRWKNVILPLAGIAKAMNLDYSEFESVICDILTDRTHEKNVKDCHWAWKKANPAQSTHRVNKYVILKFEKLEPKDIFENFYKGYSEFSKKDIPSKYISLRNKVKGNEKSTIKDVYKLGGEYNLVFDAVVVDKIFNKLGIEPNTVDTGYLYTFLRKLAISLADPIVLTKNLRKRKKYYSFNILKYVMLINRKFIEDQSYSMIYKIKTLIYYVKREAEKFVGFINTLLELPKVAFTKFEDKNIKIVSAEDVTEEKYFAVMGTIDYILNENSKYEIDFEKLEKLAPYYIERFFRGVYLLKYIIEYFKESNPKILENRLEDVIGKFFTKTGAPDTLKSLDEIKRNEIKNSLDTTNEELKNKIVDAIFRGYTFVVSQKLLKDVLRILRKVKLIPKKSRKISYTEHNLNVILKGLNKAIGKFEKFGNFIFHYLTLPINGILKNINTLIAPVFIYIAERYSEKMEDINAQ